MPLKQYNPKVTEKKWQKFWKAKKIFQAKDISPNERTYVLDMFPYPSGAGFHVGHVLGYTASDILAKYNIMRGKNVLHSMGWDAFGLPAENFAIKNKIHPAKVVKQNIANFKKELESLGLGYDWSREINTTDPEYYRWTQWVFIKLFEKGLAYEIDAPINWCPKDMTGLANEEVIDGKCERCGTPVIQKKLRQWVLKITAYADRLLEDLNLVDWPEKVKTMQKNWIGKSEGALLKFEIRSTKSEMNSKFHVEVFTTRPDTLFGATFVVIAPEHPLIQNLESRIQNLEEVTAYIAKAKNKLEEDRLIAKEKTGVELKGIKAIHPTTKKEIPIFIADYVLTSYGTGAIMAVPAHDERDFEFAQKFNLPVEVVIEPVIGEPRENEEHRKSIVAIVENPKTGELLSINWGEKLGGTLFIGGGLESGEDALETARREIREEAGYKNVKLIAQSEIVHHHYFAASKNVARNIDAIGFYFELENEEKAPQSLAANEQGRFTVEWISKDSAGARVRDPLHSYLFRKFIKGEIFSSEGILANSGTFTGMESQKAKNAITEFVGGATKINYKLRDWLFSRQRYWGEPIPIIKCPDHGNVAVPLEDLPVKLPNVKSYEPTGTGESPLANILKWVNTRCPICKKPSKRETNTMPQWAGSCWYYLRYVDPKNKKFLIDPKKEKYWLAPKAGNQSGGVDMYIGGVEHAVLHLLYARFWHKFLYDIGIVSTKEPFCKLVNQGTILGPDGQKMSKSKGNVVPAEKVIKEHGADVLRTYEMFMGPLEDAKPWDDKGIVGVRRFLDRIYALAQTLAVSKKKNKPSESITRLLHQTIKKATEDIEGLRFNTVVSALMILTNSLSAENIDKATLEALLKMLAPFAPHISEELWQNLGHKKSIFLEPWPAYDSNLIKETSVTLVIQISGKVRGQATMDVDADEEKVRAIALALPEIKKWIAGKDIKKIIYIKNKLLNIVTGEK